MVMPHWRKTFALTFVCGALVAGAAGIGAAKAESSWETLLKLQLEEQQRCELHKVLRVTRIPLGTLDGYEGRIQCRDGREFDFTQDAPNQKFILKLCQPVVC